jgi:hypothetical protein
MTRRTGGGTVRGGPGSLRCTLMSAPPHVPGRVNEPRYYSSPPRRADGWRADRPGDLVGSPQPSGPAFGNQGPDQGYLLKLAEGFRHQLVLRPGEHAADAITGASAVALRRASIFGRAPIADDLRLALTIFGYLEDAPDDLVAKRRAWFDDVHHVTMHYFAVREIADLVPEATLRSTPAEARAAYASDWKGPLGL